MSDLRVIGTSVSDEEAREARANLIEFFSILMRWSEAQSPSASTADEEPPTTATRGRSTQT